MAIGGSIASALRVGGEALTLRQIGAGSFNTTTQIRAPGATVNTSIFGLALPLSETGIDGVTVKRGDLEVWLAKTELDAASVTPVVGNLLLRGTQILTVLEVETQAVAGYYRLRARGAQ